MNKYEETISDSKEESIEKARLILQQNVLDEKTIKRPNINTKRIILSIIMVICVEVALILIAIYSYIKWITLVSLLLEIIVVILTSKHIFINFVLLYQKYAPEKLRKSCLFEPSCSEYMILSIKKYGTLKGILKGIKRILRCHSPNGGIDYP